MRVDAGWPAFGVGWSNKVAGYSSVHSNRPFSLLRRKTGMEVLLGHGGFRLGRPTFRSPQTQPNERYGLGRKRGSPLTTCWLNRNSDQVQLSKWPLPGSWFVLARDVPS
ncbi:hypothetical protein VUR80DRAFT_7438 [Thermomyces stellatus]